MKRATFDPNRHGLAVWPETWAAEVLTALEQLTVEMKVRYPDAVLAPGSSAVYALRDGSVVAAAWIEPETHEGRVVGVERLIGPVAGRS